MGLSLRSDSKVQHLFIRKKRVLRVMVEFIDSVGPACSVSPGHTSHKGEGPHDAHIRQRLLRTEYSKSSEQRHRGHNNASQIMSRT